MKGMSGRIFSTAHYFWNRFSYDRSFGHWGRLCWFYRGCWCFFLLFFLLLYGGVGGWVIDLDFNWNSKYLNQTQSLNCGFLAALNDDNFFLKQLNQRCFSSNLYNFIGSTNSCIKTIFMFERWVKGVPLGRDFFDFFTGAGLFGLLLG